VFGTYRNPTDAATISQAGAVPVRLEVTDSASVAAARDQVVQGLSGARLVGLVNNAGIPAVGPIEHVPLADVRRVLEVNVVGVIAVTQAFMPLLRAAKGRVINISSVAGRIALPFMGPYTASKHALEAVSDSLRRELLGSGVDVVVVQPGSTRSRIWDKVKALDVSPYRGTVYGPIVDRIRERALQGGERGLPAAAVAKAVRRALTARRPPTRILVTRNALLTRLVDFLPERLVDWLVGRRVWKR
jgi:NAD(P)-dependent dehydrogenase (short-subunit alcohol dehydrogenase family)